MAILLSTGTDHMLQGLNGAQSFCGARPTAAAPAAQACLPRGRHSRSLHMAGKEGQEGNATCLGAAGRAEGRRPCPAAP